jgi:hypothetical protein
MGKLYWLFHNYQVTGAAFRMPESAAEGAFVDSRSHGP